MRGFISVLLCCICVVDHLAISISFWKRSCRFLLLSAESFHCCVLLLGYLCMPCTPPHTRVPAAMAEGPVWIRVPYWSRRIPPSFIAKCCRVPSRRRSETFQVHWTLYRRRCELAIILLEEEISWIAFLPPHLLSAWRWCRAAGSFQKLVGWSEHDRGRGQQGRDSPMLGIVREGTLLLPRSLVACPNTLQ